MHRFDLVLPDNSYHLASRRAFTFAEVLFAVMILGVGMIMVAGIFPVGVRQTQQTVDTVVGDATARAGAAYVSAIADDSILTDTGGAMRFDAGLWDRVKGNAVNGADPRYAWVPFYRRLGSNPAEFVFVALRSQARDTYDATRDVLADRAVFGRGIRFDFTPGTDGAPDLITIRVNPTTNNYRAVTEGALIISAIDGRVFKLGLERPDVGALTWEVVPGSGVTVGFSDKPGLVVGRSPRDPGLPFNLTDNPYEGAAQELAFYRTTIAVRAAP